MNIIRGIIRKAQKVLIYGPGGVGKMTFAAHFPNPVFIDTDGGSASLDVARLPKPASWAMLLEEVAYIKQNPALCETLVIDTIDRAETLCVEALRAKYRKNRPEGFGCAGVEEEFGRLLNSLQELIDIGINVVLTAQAQMRRFEQTCESGTYCRWELRLGKRMGSQTAPLVKDWSDMVLFANYETTSAAADGRKNKAQSSRRVMYTEHSACWDAKNRVGLAPKLPLDYAEIASVIEQRNVPRTAPEPAAIEQNAPQSPAPEPSVNERNAPQSPAPEPAVNEQNAPRKPMPEPSVIEQNAPQKPMPELIVNGRNVTRKPMPEPAVNERNIPQSPAPETSVIERNVPQKPTPEPTLIERNASEPAVSYTPGAASLANLEWNIPPDSEKTTAQPAPVSENQKKLLDLMAENGVTIDEICAIVSKRGCSPMGTPIERFDPDCVGGVLVGAWKQVYGSILQNRAR